MSEPSPEPEISSTQPLPLSPADALAPLMAPRPVEPETDFDLAEILPVMAREPESEAREPAAAETFPLDFSLREPEPEREPLEPAAADTFPLDFSLRDPVPASPSASFAAVVRLVDGTGVQVGEFRDFGTAMECAREAIEQFADANGTWPFYAGRFIRPDLIVSVDLVPAT